MFAIPNDASESKFVIFSFISDVKLIPSILFVSGQFKIFFRIFTPLVDGLVVVGIRSLFFKTLYFLPFGNNSSSLSISCIDSFLLGIIVLKSIKSFSSSPSLLNLFLHLQSLLNLFLNFQYDIIVLVYYEVYQ